MTDPDATPLDWPSADWTDTWHQAVEVNQELQVPGHSALTEKGEGQ